MIEYGIPEEDIKEIAVVRRLLNVLFRDSPISYETLLEIQMSLHRYKEALELRLSAYAFIDEFIAKPLTFSQMRLLEASRRIKCRRFHRRIERLMGPIAQVESILNQKDFEYEISKDAIFQIQKSLTMYFFLLYRMDF
ncbi:MAG: hypothetical protein ACTSQQ_07985 [Candidatus Helarchaeota archaeon]